MTMKITDIRATCVAIPTTAYMRHNRGVHPGRMQRTIIEVITDEGAIGRGEVGGGDQRKALEKLKVSILGLDPFHLNIIKLRMLRSTYYISQDYSTALVDWKERTTSCQPASPDSLFLLPGDRARRSRAGALALAADAAIHVQRVAGGVGGRACHLSGTCDCLLH